MYLPARAASGPSFYVVAFSDGKPVSTLVSRIEGKLFLKMLYSAATVCTSTSSGSCTKRSTISSVLGG